jgi:hypothetical protein
MNWDDAWMDKGVGGFSTRAQAPWKLSAQLWLSEIRWTFYSFKTFKKIRA